MANIPIALINDFYLVRHGESEANVLNIVSSFQLGRTQHGLTPHGRQQVQHQADQFMLSHGPSSSNTITVVSSPFLRTRQTAEIILNTLLLHDDAPPGLVIIREELRERYFGEFEGQPAHESYHRAWAEDEQQKPQSSAFGCESVEDVWGRTLALLLELDATHPLGGHCFLLVSHGDAIQITRSRVRGLDCRMHRHEPHVHPSEFVKL